MQRNRDGTVSYYDEVVGTPNDSFSWGELMEDRRVNIALPGHSLAVAFAAIRLKDGRLFAVSGDSSSNDPHPTSLFVDLKKWNPDGHFGPEPEVTPGPAPAMARADGAAALLADGRVLVVGGEVAARVPTPVTTAELYNPTTNKFQTLTSHSLERTNFMATTMKDGRVLLTGGLKTADRNGLSDSVPQAEIFDPKTRTFRVVGSLLTPRYRHAAVALPDGRVLIAGGVSLAEGQSALGVEYFDPRTNTFQAGGQLPAPINGPSGLLLPNGNVLLVGGTSLQTQEAEFHGKPGATLTGYFPLATHCLIRLH